MCLSFSHDAFGCWQLLPAGTKCLMTFNFKHSIKRNVKLAIKKMMKHYKSSQTREKRYQFANMNWRWIDADMEYRIRSGNRLAIVAAHLHEKCWTISIDHICLSGHTQTRDGLMFQWCQWVQICVFERKKPQSRANSRCARQFRVVCERGNVVKEHQLSYSVYKDISLTNIVGKKAQYPIIHRMCL